MAKIKILLARMILTIMLSCTFISDVPLYSQDGPHTTMTVEAASSYNQATVKKVQQKLNKHGYNCGTPDGIAGSKTRKAVRKYQRDNKLTVTGNINSKLLKSLGVKPVKNSSSNSSAGSISTTNTNGLTVYITDTGSKYHRDGCRYLRQSKHAISKSDAQSRGYDACSVCNP